MIGILKNPGLSAAFGRVEVFYLPVNLEEDFLHYVFCFAVIMQNLESNAENQSVMAVEEHR